MSPLERTPVEALSPFAAKPSFARDRLVRGNEGNPGARNARAFAPVLPVTQATPVLPVQPRLRGDDSEIAYRSTHGRGFHPSKVT